MSAKSQSTLISDISAAIISGGRKTTAANIRALLNDYLDSYANIVDGGLLYQAEVGYSSAVALTSPTAFAYKKWVEDNFVPMGGIGTLAQTLAVGNTTSGQNIVLTDDDKLQIGSTAGRYIGYDTNLIQIGLGIVNTNSNDHIVLQDGGGIHVDTTFVELPHLTASRVIATDANNRLSALTGTGLLSLNAGAISYDTNTYLTTGAAALAYQPLDSDLTSWAGVTRASGFDTFVATPSSANLSSLLTDKTGTGVSVFGTSPTFTTDITTPKINGVSGNLLLTNAVQTSGAITNFTFTNSANTGQTASTEISNFKVNGATKTWAAGAITTQRWNYFTANTAAFASASTITNSYGLYVEAATAGSNASITNNWSAGFSGNVLATSAISAPTKIVSQSLTTTQYGLLEAQNDNGSYARLNCYGSAFGVTAFQNNGAFGFKNSGYMIADGDVANSGTNSLYFLTGGYTPTTQTRLTIDSNGNTVQGTAALATNATNGFLYIETCAGTPTGVPTSYTGRTPIVVDSTNNKLYCYNSSWQEIPTINSTSTFTNKRLTKRVTTITSSATPTINTDNCDAVTITALATNITSFTTNLSGTPNNFDELTIRIKDDGTARTLAWGASFEAKGVALPTTTVISKVLTVKFIWDSVTSKWGCVASAQEV